MWLIIARIPMTIIAIATKPIANNAPPILPSAIAQTSMMRQKQINVSNT